MTKTILVVDDEKRLVSLVESYLTREGYRVVSAHDGNGESAGAGIHRDQEADEDHHIQDPFGFGLKVGFGHLPFVVSPTEKDCSQSPISLAMKTRTKCEDLVNDLPDKSRWYIIRLLEYGEVA